MLSEGAIVNTREISANIARMCAQPEVPSRKGTTFAQEIGAGYRAIPHGIATIFGRASVPFHHSIAAYHAIGAAQARRDLAAQAIEGLR